MASDRDRLAGIKLMGATLRLREFTAVELAEFAGVNLETARAFLRPDKGPGLVEAVSATGRHGVTDKLRSTPDDFDATKTSSSVENGRTGRPANVYRLAAGKRDVALEKLADYRRGLEFGEQVATKDPDDSVEDLTPVSLLEASLTAFEAGKVNNFEEWQDRIRQARIYLEGAGADLKAMRSGVNADSIRQSTKRFGIAQGRLAAVEQNGAPKDAATKPKQEKLREPVLPWVEGLEDWLRLPFAHDRPHRYGLQVQRAPQTARTSYVDLLDPFVGRFGKWAGANKVGMFEPVVVLFDGVQGRDPMSSWLIESCGARGVRVAVIDLLKTKQRDRFGLYGAIDRLRATTPLALADVVMTMDSGTKTASLFAAEIKDLSVVGMWEAKSNWGALAELEDFAKLDVDALREFFVDAGVKYANIPADKRQESPIDAQQRLHACRVVSALTTVTAVRAAEAATSPEPLVLSLPGETESQSSELRATASKLMGHLICYDSAHSFAIEKELSEAAVKYVPRAVEQMRAGSWQSHVSTKVRLGQTTKSGKPLQR